MKGNEMFPRKYATGEDLQGKAVTLVIERIAGEKMRPGPGAKEELKWVVYFKGAKKGVILNRTLANQIADIVAEEDTDRWPGQKVTIYPEPLMVAGVPRIGIRARVPVNGPAEPPPALAHDEEDDF